jgi:C-terminal processing protease CtpA/Prc
METVKKLHDPEIPVIFDLRSNGGGDDTFGYRLSAFFHKTSGDFNFPNPYEKQVTSQTPETQVLKVNVAKYWLRGKVSEKKPLETYLGEQEEELQRILANRLPEQKVSYNDKIPNDWTFDGYSNPIYILIDENCYSSCESTVDTFEYNPNVKKVGRSTGGMIHFGNVSPAFLKHSKLYVQIPTHANIYRDGRFIEKEGIKPDVEVNSGKDALKFIMERLIEQ